MIKADLHNHLGRNGSFSSVNEVVDMASARLGPGGVFGIVNSNQEDKRYERFADSPGYERQEIGDIRNGVYFPDKDITAVRVQEISTRQGDLLVAGLKKHLNLGDNRQLEDSLNEATDYNGVRFLVHPFYKHGIGSHLRRLHEDYILDRVKWAAEGLPAIFTEREKSPILRHLQWVNAIEVFNAQAELWIPFLTQRNANPQALDFYHMIQKEFDLNIGMCSFSDSHSSLSIGLSYTLISPIRLESSGALVSSLRESFRGVKTTEQLHCTPAKLEALKHAINMKTGRGIFLNE